MQPKERRMLFLIGCLKLGDTITDVYYILTQEFYSLIIYYLILGFLIAPTCIMFLVFILSLIFQKHDFADPLTKANLIIFLTLVFGEQCGLCSIVYSIYYSFKRPGREKDSLLFMIKAASINNIFFESMPQLVLQLYNSGHLQNINIAVLCSCIISGLSIIFTFCKLFYAYDQQSIIHTRIEMMTAAKYLSSQVWRNTDYTIEQINK
jgi:hypothetical protein